MRLWIQKFLVVYAAVVSTVLLTFVLVGAKKPASPEFDVVRAHRIDIVEPDGTLRMVISNHDKLPPVIIHGKEQKMVDARPQAGMLFYNDEGTENGGLIFGGKKNAQGEVMDSGGSLSFDKYGAGQILQLAGVDDKDHKFAGLAVGQGGQRIWIGHGDTGVASVSLSDANGKNRIIMQVGTDGTPSLTFFDAQGHAVQQLVPR